MKYIITESQESSIKLNLKNKLKKRGVVSASSIVGGIENIFKIFDIESPMDFLHLFDDLEQVQSEEREDWTLFRYKPKHNLMIYDKKNEEVYINHYEIWSVLEDDFDLNYSEIQQITQEWLGDVYNLRGVTPLADVMYHEV